LEALQKLLGRPLGLIQQAKRVLGLILGHQLPLLICN
jgi:hypothetical protein